LHGFPTSTLSSCIHISLLCFDECFNQAVLFQFECTLSDTIFRNCLRCCFCSHNSLSFVVHNLSSQWVTVVRNTSVHFLVRYHIVSAFCSAVRCCISVRLSVLLSWLLLMRKPSLVCFILSFKQDG
jgi:hypothetical protein